MRIKMRVKQVFRPFDQINAFSVFFISKLCSKSSILYRVRHPESTKVINSRINLQVELRWEVA